MLRPPDLPRSELPLCARCSAPDRAICMSASGRVMIVQHDRRWAERGEGVIAQLRTALGPTALRVDHIGSTAIPAMDAKNVIDIQVSVADLERAQAQFDKPLQALGFERLPYDRDHVPVGRSDDPASWAKRFWRRRDHVGGDVNLHVRVVGSPNERLALLFRDWMRTHPEAVVAYSATKRSLAAATSGLDVYSEVKDPIVDLVITIAETWAVETGWSASPEVCETAHNCGGLRGSMHHVFRSSWIDREVCDGGAVVGVGEVADRGVGGAGIDDAIDCQGHRARALRR